MVNVDNPVLDNKPLASNSAPPEKRNSSTGVQDFSVHGAYYHLPLTDFSNKTKERILIEVTILFAKRGFSAVSMRTIAEAIGIKAASLYNHFASKEDLWLEVVNHAQRIYLLYFQRLNEAVKEANTFEELLEIIFREPKTMRNIFPCYAFSLIRSEQFRDGHAGKIFNSLFLKYSIDFIQEKFDAFVSQGKVIPFDTRTVATMCLHSVLMAIDIRVHEMLGRDLPCDFGEMLAAQERFIIWAVRRT
ncbi:MAG: TetR/AcrR family transcriptional regulator [Planctomycetota bacterium]|jgi:AcrR family transcriptional regulator|nr:TetR/AcrR family transcriptional regulator [Planctomycetota bacterium]